MSITTKELPEAGQPYMRCMTLGAGNLSDAELLAIIFRSGSTGINATDLALCLLQNAGGSGLIGLHSLSLSDMTAIKGIGKVKALQILALCEIAKRMATSRASERICLNSPASVADYFMEPLRHFKQEHFYVALFNSNNELISYRLITIGTINASVAAPREIFLESLRCHAVYIILIHNHPSGEVTPSREDKLVTKRMASCGQLLGISVVDHIIIGDNKYFSFKEAELI